MAKKAGKDLLNGLSRAQKGNVTGRHVGYRESTPALLYEVKAAAGASCDCPPDCTCDKDLYCRFINKKLQRNEERRVGEIGREIDNELSQALAYRAEVLGNLEDVGKAIGKGGKAVGKGGKAVGKGIGKGKKWFADFVDKHWE